ncbi:hypothetical protein BSNK01_06870 [Bacillaceae bacterium]
MRMSIEEREKYRLKRIQKKIKLKKIAKMLGCTSALICMFENGKTDMAANKVWKYKLIIDNWGEKNEEANQNLS